MSRHFRFAPVSRALPEFFAATAYLLLLFAARKYPDHLFPVVWIATAISLFAILIPADQIGGFLANVGSHHLRFDLDFALLSTWIIASTLIASVAAPQGRRFASGFRAGFFAAVFIGGALALTAALPGIPI